MASVTHSLPLRWYSRQVVLSGLRLRWVKVSRARSHQGKLSLCEDGGGGAGVGGAGLGEGGPNEGNSVPLNFRYMYTA